MITIYTDLSQCRSFEVSYSSDDEEWKVRASDLLKTKNYDQKHKEFLEPLGDSVLQLRSAPGRPGWWNLVKVER